MPFRKDCPPGLLIIITFMALLGRGSIQLVLVLGISTGIANSRVIRGAVIAIKANENVAAAPAIGNSHFRILLRHIIPNIFATVIVLFTITIGNVFIAEAGLIFLGYGLPHGTPRGMLNWKGRQYMESNPGLAFWPGMFLMITVFSVNMFGDASRVCSVPGCGVGRAVSALRRGNANEGSLPGNSGRLPGSQVGCQ